MITNIILISIVLNVFISGFGIDSGRSGTRVGHFRGGVCASA